jgi:transcriptional regulator with XRE-family HTH domain
MTALDQSSIFDVFGDVLRRYRKERGLRQIELATEAAVDHSLVSRWENGRVLPTWKDIGRIAGILRLTPEEFEEMQYAWCRDKDRSDPVDSQLCGSVEAWAESIRLSIDCVRALRKAGHPRMALRLSRRDANTALSWLRSRSWTSAHEHALLELSELFLEECKAGLDFLPRASIRAGELSRTIYLQGLVCRPREGSAVPVFHVLAQEGVAYVAGNVGAAHDLGLSLLDEIESISSEWVPEIIRAVAINAGVLEDAGNLRRAEGSLHRFLQRGSGLRSGTHAFVLEGIARGWCKIDKKRANEVVHEAWGVREGSDDSEALSSLRFVQLVRSQAEIELSLRSRCNVGDTSTKVCAALAISRREGYDRYVSQLERLSEIAR